MNLGKEIESIRETAKRFSERYLAPITEKDYKENVFRREIFQEMGKLGFFGCLIPEEYGGTNTGYLAGVVITEEIAKVNASYGGFTPSQAAGPALTILRYGTEEQKKKYIPEIVQGEKIAFFSMTEPDAGSDVLSMKTVAVKEDGFYRINGTKNWVTHAPYADIGLVWVYTDKEKRGKGLSCFIVDLNEVDGIEIRNMEKIGLKCTQTGEMIFQDSRIPKENLLGQEGQGYEILLYTLSNTRLFAAARAIGIAHACLEESVKYAKERVQFGKPISEFQMIQNQLVEMYISIEAARLLVYQVAMNKDSGIHDITELAVAKVFSAETAITSAITAMKIFSAYGYSPEYPVYRYLMDAMASPITEGTSNIQKLIIARNLLKEKT